MIIEVNGGVSVLSAFVNGHGGAASLKMPMQTEIIESPEDLFPTPEIKKLVDYIRSKYSIRDYYSINIKSSIPQGKGLKSSSALAISVVFGILEMNSVKFSDEEILKIAAKASIYNNTSVTGAMDDLAMAYYGGFCLTDNRNFRLITRERMREDYVLICTGSTRIESINLKDKDFSSYVNFYNGLENMLSKGMIYETMMLNGCIFDDGSDNLKIKELLGTGAIFAGRSGKGPAIFAIYKSKEDMETAFKSLILDGREVTKSRFNNEGIHITGT